MKKKILIPTDLTEAADQAIRQATVIAEKAGFTLVLLHVLDSRTSSSENTEIILNNQATRINSESGITCEVLVKYGNIFDIIPMEASDQDYALVVIVTHGIKGLKQRLFGADILKLVSKIPVPTLVVQEQSKLLSSCEKILLPVSTHQSFDHTLDATILFARMFQSEVILYSIYKPGFEWPDELLKNIERGVRELEKQGIRMTRIREDQNVYSMGYSKQTLNYAKSSGADIICIIPVSSREYYYFAQSDKESLLLNDLHLPILCARGNTID